MNYQQNKLFGATVPLLGEQEPARFQQESPRNTPVFVCIGRLLGLNFLLSVVQWNSVTFFTGARMFSVPLTLTAYFISSWLRLKASGISPVSTSMAPVTVSLTLCSMLNLADIFGVRQLESLGYRALLFL